jgi:hypothetical protein
MDNTIAVLLKCSERVYRIKLLIQSLYFERVSAAIQKPFPELTRLELQSDETVSTVLPDSFLGGSARRLRFLSLSGIPLPGLPKLLLSATHLVHLSLCRIPHSGYFSPDAIVTALSGLTSLEVLHLEFQSPLSCPDWTSRSTPPPTRTLLPVLTHFQFKGVSDYLDDLVARIDAPRLDKLNIFFFNQIVFETPQLFRFLSRAPLKPFEKAHVAFMNGAARVTLSSLVPNYRKLEVRVSCRELDWQVSSLEQVGTSFLPLLSTLEALYIYEVLYLDPYWRDNVEDTLWLELLHPFSAAKNLYLSRGIVQRIAPAVGRRSTEVLPTLQNIFLEGLDPSGPVQGGIGQFVSARQATSHPIAVLPWGNSEQDKIYY